MYRRVISASVGHFKLGITQDGLEHKTSCISYGASSIAVSEALDSLDPVDDLGGSKVVRKGDGSSGYSYRYLYDISASNSSGNMVDSVELKLIGSGVDIGCSRLSTLGYWDEATNWNSGMVPASNDEASSNQSVCISWYTCWHLKKALLRPVAKEVGVSLS